MTRRIREAGQALRAWGVREWLTAAASTLGVGLVLGWVTVLIPNPVFGREIPPTPWSYPVWVVTSLLSGLLIATYVSPPGDHASDRKDERLSGWGTIGAIGSWFAIGCPVCNKLALLALGYSGAISYFGPAQPFLAALSLVLLLVGLVYRLSGSVACELPRSTQRGSLVDAQAS